MNGRAGRAVPHDRGFPLVGDADSRDVARRETCFHEYLTRGIELRLPDLQRVVLHPSRLGKDLLEFFLGDGADGAVVIEDDGAGAGGSLVEGEDSAAHGPPVLAPGARRQARRWDDLSRESAENPTVNSPTKQL